MVLRDQEVAVWLEGEKRAVVVERRKLCESSDECGGFGYCFIYP